MSAALVAGFTAVVFDMDGVLLDSEPLHLRATQAALGDRGPSFTERDNQAFFGATDEELFRVLRILFDLPTSTAELVAAKREHTVALIRAEARPLPGVPDVPRGLAALGLSLGLASASPRPVIQVVLERLDLTGTFQAVVSGDEVARGKPAPDGFLMAARRLGVAPGRCLVVEDSRNGVLAAKAAGMTVAAIPCPATSHEDFSPADLVLPSLEALPKALGYEDRLEGGRMSSGQPGIKRALDWVLARLTEEPRAKRSALVEEASRRFDLTPLEADFLYRQLVETLRPTDPGSAPSTPS